MPLLAHSPAEIVRDWMVSQGLGATPAQGGTQPEWPIVVDAITPTPNDCIAVADTTGVKFAKDAYGNATEHFGIQVMVRAGTRRPAWVKANVICEAFDNLLSSATVTIGASSYCLGMIRRTSSSPIRMPPEQGSSRRMFSINALVYVRPS